MNHHAEITDADLCSRIQKDEKEAFQLLYSRYAPRIYQFSYHYLKNKDDSQELVQDVFIRIWEKRNSLDAGQNIKAYIFKVTVNVIYDWIRHKNVKQAFADLAQLNQSVEESTWQTVVYDDMKEKIIKLTEKLPEQQKRVFLLSRFDGLSNKEIAGELNLSKRTVENHLFRAIHFLKTHLEKESVLALLILYLL